ncbi:ketopantoate hydroxymethyltransferase-domain-containing protein [Mucor mucedo]|uniref:ketopantoate hydroxymethyltransferase-domain-containing protein n=1 Tax=Mucor mucedo TaxID=29922 RepID=UPI0022202B53|nr:ketopantoate hydroxymethyltransferase-domain-containing protein [Mucor mucedo]KAI7897252.1 ketopantoate hydroxymethyltransferase-domain-containing protein [Mucor mucedo]
MSITLKTLAQRAFSKSLTGHRCYSSRPMETAVQSKAKVSIKTIQSMYRRKEAISMMTAQDYPSGLVVDQAGIDLCLVGDSLAMVSLGFDSTNPLTVDDMLHHCRAVARGCKAPFIIADLPYGSYEASPDDAVRVSLRFMKEGHCDAVKLEGGEEMAETIRRITRVGIPVLAHIGLTPQRQSSLGGFRVQGKTAKQATALLKDALAVQEAGAFGMVIEAVPEQVAGYITEQLKVPTIGIGAGVQCSGQVLVQNDALGLFDKFVPKFTKQYCNLNQIITNALREYHEETEILFKLKKVERLKFEPLLQKCASHFKNKKA